MKPSFTENLRSGKTSLLTRPLGMARILVLLMLGLGFSACATPPQTKVSGNLNHLSKQQTVAILPVQILGDEQKEAAALFRQSLFANLKQSKFNVLERYIVDGLLEQQGLNDPSKYQNLSPMRMGELLGADAVILSRINKVKKSYLIIHSSIELSVSIRMVDTRSGELLWTAEHTETDFQGIGKIPTGLAAAVLGPIYFATNKLGLSQMTAKMVNKLTAIVKRPETADEEKTFENPVIASAAVKDFERLEQKQQDNLEKAEARARAEASRQEKNSSGTQKNILVASNHRSESGASPLLLPGLNFPNLSVSPPKQAATQESTSPPTGPDAKPKSTEEAGKKKPNIFYTIQVGAYKTRDHAKGMIQALLKKGYKVFLTLFKKDETRLYKVQVEQFKKRKEAIRFAEKFERQENIDHFVTRVKIKS